MMKHVSPTKRARLNTNTCLLSLLCLPTGRSTLSPVKTASNATEAAPVSSISALLHLHWRHFPQRCHRRGCGGRWRRFPRHCFLLHHCRLGGHCGRAGGQCCHRCCRRPSRHRLGCCFFAVADSDRRLRMLKLWLSLRGRRIRGGTYNARTKVVVACAKRRTDLAAACAAARGNAAAASARANDVVAVKTRTWRSNLHSD